MTEEKEPYRPPPRICPFPEAYDRRDGPTEGAVAGCLILAILATLAAAAYWGLKTYFN